MDRRRATTGLAVLLTTSGCGELQPAEPLAKTLPVGLAVLAGTAALVWSITARTLRQLQRQRVAEAQDPAAAVLRWPRATAAAALAPGALAALVVAGFGGLAVAFGYREPHVNVLSWSDTLVITCVLAGLAVAATALGSLLATSLDRAGWARGAALAVLVVLLVPGGAASAGLTLAWLPAAVLGLVRAEPAPGGAVPERQPSAG